MKTTKEDIAVLTRLKASLPTTMLPGWHRTLEALDHVIEDSVTQANATKFKAGDHVIYKDDGLKGIVRACNSDHVLVDTDPAWYGICTEALNAVILDPEFHS